MSLAELTAWLLTSIMLVALVLYPAVGGGWPGAPRVLAVLVLMAYARSVRYLRAEPNTGWYQLFVFLLAPLYAVLHLLMLVPLRYYSLATLRDGGWGTRDTVEVTLQHPSSPQPQHRQRVTA